MHSDTPLIPYKRGRSTGWGGDTLAVMPKSRSRAKKSKGKAWRTGRAGSEYEESLTEPGPDAGLSDMVEALSLALADDEEQFYSDELLGRVLVRRGWDAVHVHLDEESSDMWTWPASAPTGDSWVPTAVTVLEDGYLVQFADFESLMRDEHAEYGSREELLDDLERIEAYRHPADPRH
ncbi:hypothetical protein MTOK_60290 [Mycolicibacterium tokaiense]|nr:hypothetical protein MTOK_60290 [Mycolicibacterium tokaiense]